MTQVRHITAIVEALVFTSAATAEAAVLPTQEARFNELTAIDLLSG